MSSKNKNSLIENAISDNQDIEKELEWHITGPQSKYWKELVEVKYKNSQIAATKVLLAKRYIEIHNNRDKILRNYHYRENLELACKLVSLDIIDMVIQEMLYQIILLLQTLKYQLIQLMKDAVVKSTYNLLNFSSLLTEKEPSGLITLLKGTLLDMILSDLPFQNNNQLIDCNSTFKVNSFHATICNGIPIQTIENEESSKFKVISVENDICQDFIKIESLKIHELNVWNNINILPILDTGSIILPNNYNVSCLSLCPISNCDSSHLFIGTTIGILLIYIIPWNGSTPILKYMTNNLQKGMISPIIEINNSYIHTNLIITRYEDGNIRVWDITSTTQKKLTTIQRIFNLRKQKSVSVPSCVLLLQENDFNLPTIRKRPIIEHYMKKILDDRNKILNSQQESFVEVEDVKAKPTTSSFFNNYTMLGSNTSILVGLSNGNIIKYNLDYNIENFASPIYQSTLPFCEYASTNINNNILIVAKNKKVFKEIFHFSNTKILFLGIYKNHLFYSIDEENNFITWSYNLDNFTGKFWFEPLNVNKLDFTNISYIIDERNTENSKKSNQVNNKEKLHVNSQLNSQENNGQNNFKLTNQPNSHEMEILKEIKIYRQIENNISYIVKEYKPIKNDNNYIKYYEYNNSNNIIWFSQIVKPIIYTSEIISIKQSFDHDDIILLVRYYLDKIVQYLCIYTYIIESQQFSQNFPRIDIHPKDKICDNFWVSAIINETLCRYAYLLINNCIRIFSLSTGITFKSLSTHLYISIEMLQVTNQYIPFQIPLKSFDSSIFNICSSNRIIVVADKLDKRMGIYMQTKSDPLMIYAMTEQEKLGLEKSIEYLESKAIDLNIPIDIFKEDNELVNFIKDEIIDGLILNEIDIFILKKENLILRKQRIEMVYETSTDLGIVHPTSWPSDTVNDKLMSISDSIESVNRLLA